MSDDFEELEESAQAEATLEEQFQELKSIQRIESYTREQIEELRRGGMPKPEGVSWAEWNTPLKLNPGHELIIYLATKGWSYRKIAEETGYTREQVSNIMCAPEVRKLVALKNKEIYGDAPKARLQAMTNKALDNLEGILNNEQEKSSLKADISKYVIDQGVGKAQQAIEHSGNLLMDLITRLDSEKSRDITPESEKLAKSTDPIDAFIDDFVPKNMKVGVRGKSETEA